jgi:hypothetical protein
MMTFDQYGYLTPYTVIETDLQTFERMFVSDFSKSSKRQKWFDNYLEYVHELQMVLGIGFVQWVNGSFTTRKFNPDDIDFITFLDFDMYEKFENEIETFKKRRYSRHLGTDGYFLKTYPPTHSLYKIYELERKRWIYDFSTNYKNLKPKGFIELKF